MQIDYQHTDKFVHKLLEKFNLIACFMTKPFMGVSASGCHTNMSLWTGGKDVS